MKNANLLQKGTKQIVLGVAGFLCCLVQVMGYYPLIPAFYAACYLNNERMLLLYVGILGGMAYFLSLTSIVKYLFAIVLITVTVRFYIWANRKCSSIVAGCITGLVMLALNISGNMIGDVGGREILMGMSESVLVAGATIILSFLMAIGSTYINQLSQVQDAGASFDLEEGIDYIEEPEKQKKVQDARIAVFATAMNGLSESFMQTGACRERNPAQAMQLLRQEVTGKICMACEGCAVCWDSPNSRVAMRVQHMLSQVMNHRSKDEILQDMGADICPHYSAIVEEAVQAFGRMELNEAWYHRLQENRFVIAQQLDAMAEVLEKWTKGETCLDKKYRVELAKIGYEAKEKGILADKIHIFGDTQGRICVKALVQSKWGGAIPSRNYRKAIEQAMDRPMRLERDTGALLTRESVWITAYEDTQFYTMVGIASRKKDGSVVSGDSFSFFDMEDGHSYICLSDGMGTGEMAQKESELVVDLLEKFIEAGFSEEVAVGLMNSAMVFHGENKSFSTLDMASIDLYSGGLALTKIGACASFLKSAGEVEIIEGAGLPTGVSFESDIQKETKTLKNGDFLVMVSDGVLEYLHVKDPKTKLADILCTLDYDNAGLLAEKLLDRILPFCGGHALDDMTILTVGCWEK